jgi:hypothetical protein
MMSSVVAQFIHEPAVDAGLDMSRVGCPHREKDAYGSRQLATRVAGELSQHFHEHTTAYFCQCGWWHLTVHAVPKPSLLAVSRKVGTGS